MNLASIIDPHPDEAAAIVSSGEVTTYGALRQQVAGVRGGLVELGVAPGDRVAIVTANSWFFPVAYLAVLGAGGVAVPLNPLSPPVELQRELAAVRAKVAVIGPAGSASTAGVDRAAVGIEHVLVQEGVDLLDAASFEDLLVHDPVPVVDRDDDDLAVLMFTSGTAGAPKAAMLTHGNLLANLAQAQALPARALRAGDVCLGVLPMFHIFGLNVVLGLSLHAGASVVLVQRFDPDTALITIRERGVTVIAGAPPMYAAWLGLAGAGRADFASVRLAASGASRLDASIADAFEQRFGVRLSEGYGLTEASPIVTSSAGDSDRPGSIGVPLPGVEVRLVDEEGEDALVGDPGEIWVRGPNVFKGYLDDAEATANALTPDGWLRTGDIAVADDAGALTIVDRSKDLVIVSGFNVYPAEVEEALMAHPGIAEVAVVGVPHPHSGEAVKAYVVTTGDRMLEEDEVIEFCATRLARYKCPSKILFVSELPRGQGGKLLRRALH